MENKKKVLREHENFKNQCIASTIALFFGGLLLSSDTGIFTKSASEGGNVLFMFAAIMLFISIFNIISFKENVKDYEKITGKKYGK